MGQNIKRYPVADIWYQHRRCEVRKYRIRGTIIAEYSAFRLTPVDTAPYYGAKNTGYILCTMDGIQIDTNMNAIDTDGNPIEGLYIVGNDSGSYFANTYPNLSTGMACGRTVTFGRHVGKYLSTL